MAIIIYQFVLLEVTIVDKPFIKLLQSPNNKYFYDVNKNELVQINLQSYDYLSSILKGELSDFSESEEIASLRKQGYLSSYKVEEIEHYYTKYCESILSRKVRKVTLQLTQSCNFRCKYCSYTQSNPLQRHHANKEMSKETAEKAIRFLRDHSVDCPDVCVGFYGGEPLLKMELVKELTKYAEKILSGKNIIFTITTNGSLLTDDIVEFFLLHDFHVVISLDGPKEINDKNRVYANGTGTFDSVIKNLEHIYHAYYDFYKSQVTINSVIDPSIDFDDVVNLCSSNLLKEAKVTSSLIDDSASDQKNNYSEAFTSKYVYNKFLGLLSLLNRFPYDMLSPIIQQSLGRLYDQIMTARYSPGLPSKGAPGGPCIPGESRLLVTVDENLVICERVNEISDPMIIGTLSTGFDMQKVDALLNIAKLTSEECKNCWAYYQCGLCCKFADNHGELSGDYKKQFCKSSENDLFLYLQHLMLFKEVNNYTTKRA